MKWQEFAFIVAAAAVASIIIRIALKMYPAETTSVLHLGRPA